MSTWGGYISIYLFSTYIGRCYIKIFTKRGLAMFFKHTDRQTQGAMGAWITFASGGVTRAQEPGSRCQLVCIELWVEADLDSVSHTPHTTSIPVYVLIASHSLVFQQNLGANHRSRFKLVFVSQPLWIVPPTAHNQIATPSSTRNKMRIRLPFAGSS